MQQKKASLMLIDLMGIVYRSFFAFERIGLTFQGQPTGAVYGTALFLQKLMGDFQPEFIAFANDSAEKSFRNDALPSYKAQREKMPDDLSIQLPAIYELVSTYGVVFSQPGLEADDIIGRLVNRFSSSTQIYIVSGDKDFYQLVDECVTVVVPKKNEPYGLVTPAKVKEKFGCEPKFVVDYLALVGDSADNIPGVKGIGPKTAAKLLAEFGNLEGILENLSRIIETRAGKLLDTGRELATLSKTLATIDCEPSWETNEETLQSRILEEKSQIQREKLYASFGFTSLIKGKVDSEKSEIVTPVFRKTDHFEEFAQKCVSDGIVGITLISSPSQNFQELVLCVSDGTFVLGKLEEVFESLHSTLFINPEVIKVGHGLKEIFSSVSHSSPHLVNYFDIMVADYLIDPNQGNHDLNICWNRCGTGILPIDRDDWDIAMRSWAIRQLYEPFEKLLKSHDLMKTFEEIESPLIPVLAEIERNGVFVDREFLSQFSEKVALDVKALEIEIFSLAGKKFNINSPKQLQNLLFVELKVQEQSGLTNLKKTKTGYSTDESVLRKLVAHPICAKIIEYRTSAKLKSTYLDSLPQFVDKESQKIHCRYNQVKAATGRLSCDHPNLQNIPNRSQYGQEIRKAFKPLEAGWIYLAADYSQIEIRLLAELSQSEDLIAAFRRGEDIHRATAATIFGLAQSAVSSELRSRAKAVNFGIIYGMGPQRLAQDTGVTINEAKQFIAKYFAAYPAIEAFQKKCIEDAKNRGYSVTLLGRKRPIPGLSDRNKFIANRAANIAINSPIQGYAADIIKLAMIKFVKLRQNNNLKGRLIMQIHDELVFECPMVEQEILTEIARESMETAVSTKVPLSVNIKAGENWYSL